MKEKKVCYTEAAYLIGIAALALGTAMMEKADFGMSAVVAPAYILYRRGSQISAWFTFGMAEYILQAVLLVILAILVRRFRKGYLFSFVTAVFYGIVLDLCMALFSGIIADTMVLRMFFYLIGLAVCAVGVAFFFHTYIAPEAYELIVKEVSSVYGYSIDRVKTVYDVTSFLTAIVLSFLFFGFGVFEGVKLGTVFCTLVNGTLIGSVSRLIGRSLVFKDRLPFRKLFA